MRKEIAYGNLQRSLVPTDAEIDIVKRIIIISMNMRAYCEVRHDSNVRLVGRSSASWYHFYLRLGDLVLFEPLGLDLILLLRERGQTRGLGERPRILDDRVPSSILREGTQRDERLNREDLG